MFYENWSWKKRATNCFLGLLMLNTVICAVTSFAYGGPLWNSAVDDFNNDLIPSNNDTGFTGTCSNSTSLNGNQLTNANMCASMTLMFCENICNTIVYYANTAVNLLLIGFIPSSVVGTAGMAYERYQQRGCAGFFSCSRIPAPNNDEDAAPAYGAMDANPEAPNASGTPSQQSKLYNQSSSDGTGPSDRQGANNASQTEYTRLEM